MAKPGVHWPLPAVGASSFCDYNVSRQGLLEVGVYLKAVVALEGMEIHESWSHSLPEL